MEHRGEILNEVLQELGIKKSALAKRMKVTPTTISNWVGRSDLSDAQMLEIGNALHFDFSQKIPSLKRLISAAQQAVEEQHSIVQEHAVPYMRAHPAQMPTSLEECQRAYRALEIQFMDLQAQHIKVLSKLARVA